LNKEPPFKKSFSFTDSIREARSILSFAKAAGMRSSCKFSLIIVWVMTNIFVRDYYNSWLKGITGFFTPSGGLAPLPPNLPPEVTLLFAILEQIHTGQAMSIELQLLQRRTGCDRSDIEVLQVLSISQSLPLEVSLTENIVSTRPTF
jgi:hypothetical protein